MSTFQTVINSIKSSADSSTKRQELIKGIEAITKRRLLIYVADVNKPDSTLKPEDKTGFSDLLEGINEKTVDLLINSPGGFAEVTEAIVGMLRSKFDSIRFAIPNMAKSAATLLTLSGDELLMDERSELGPIDPQVEYPTAEGRKREAAEDILEGFQEAKEVLANEGPSATPAYVPLLNKYTIGLLRGCQNAMKLSRELAQTWLQTYMLPDDKNSAAVTKIVEYFASHSNTLSHNRSIGIDKCKELGIKVVDLRENDRIELRQKIWELWCVYELHFERTPVHKIYENSSGCSLNKQAAVQVVQVPAGPSRKPQQPTKPLQAQASV
jgi:hypothetical protein